MARNKRHRDLDRMGANMRTKFLKKSARDAFTGAIQVLYATHSPSEVRGILESATEIAREYG